MSPRPAIGAAACVGVLLMGTFAPSASASGERLLFRLQGSNGYKIYGIREGATGAIIATRGRHPHDTGLSASLYLSRATTSRGRLDAAFGKLGRLDLRFRPSGRVSYGKRHRHCRGPDRYTTHYGVFVGTARFKGEGGFTAVNAHRVKGKAVTPTVLHCFNFIGGRPRSTIWDALTSPSTVIFSHPSPGDGFAKLDLRSPPRIPQLLGGRGRRTALSAHWHIGVAAQVFGAVQRGRKRPVFFAGMLQTRERVATVRLAVAVGSRGDLLASDSLSTATVTPPQPFGGEGSFRHSDSGAKSWTGALTVAFPGAPNVSLTGPQFEVGLSQGF